MTKFFMVVWIVTTWISTPCPGYKIDEYNPGGNSKCLVAHGTLIKTQMEKRFETKELAEKFIALSPYKYEFKIKEMTEQKSKKSKKKKE